MATIRPAEERDWPAVGRLAELFIDAHHRFDSFRFLTVAALTGEMYTTHVREDIRRGRATLLVAVEDDRVIGFVFAGIEPESWKEFRPEAGFIHDLVVDPPRRNAGVGRALVVGALDWFAAQRIGRIMLWSAAPNVGAQRLFASFGFRPTMVEMTLDARASG